MADSTLLLELEKQLASVSAKVLHTVAYRKGGLVEYRGKEVIDFTSFDFLGLRNNSKLKVAAQREIELSGLGHSSSRLSSGNARALAMLEDRLALFLGHEAALSFSSKNQAVLSLLTPLLSERDVLIFDELVQSPVADACYLVNSASASFRHGDLESLRQELERFRSTRRRLVFVESVSPVSGAIYDLKTAAAICAQYGAQLVVDESYAVGALGLRGAGVCDLLGLRKEVFCLICDLSLGLASIGGVVCGPKVLIQTILNRSRALASDTPPAPAFASACEAAINLLEVSLHAREKLSANLEKLRAGLPSSAIMSSGSSFSPIVSFLFHKPSLARELSAALLHKGFLLDTLSVGMLLNDSHVVRMAMSAEHSEKQIEEFLKAFLEIHPRLSK